MIEVDLGSMVLVAGREGTSMEQASTENPRLYPYGKHAPEARWFPSSLAYSARTGFSTTVFVGEFITIWSNLFTDYFHISKNAIIQCNMQT